MPFKIVPDERTYVSGLQFFVHGYIDDELENIFKHSNFYAYPDLSRDFFKLFVDKRIRQRMLNERQKKLQDIMRRIRSRKFNSIRQCFDYIRFIEQNEIHQAIQEKNYQEG